MVTLLPTSGKALPIFPRPPHFWERPSVCSTRLLPARLSREPCSVSALDPSVRKLRCVFPRTSSGTENHRKQCDYL